MPPPQHCTYQVRQFPCATKIVYGPDLQNPRTSYRNHGCSLVLSCELYAMLKTKRFLVSTSRPTSNTTSAIVRGIELHKRYFQMFRRYDSICKKQ